MNQNLKKAIFALIAVTVLIAVASWYPQFSQGYDVQNQARLACNDLIKVTRFGPEAGRDYSADFINGCRRVGVRLKTNQFDFKVAHDKNAGVYTCDVQVQYPVNVEVFTIGAIFEIKPYHFVKRIDLRHEVPDSY